MKYNSIHDTSEHIGNVNIFGNEIISDLSKRLKKHDFSKLDSPEKEIFDEYTEKLKYSTYGSEEYKEFLKEMKVALDHHYKVNRHHPEHFENGILDMNLIDIIEMLIDWKAATLRHDNGDILKSIEINSERFNYSPELKAILKNTIEYMGWE